MVGTFFQTAFKGALGRPTSDHCPASLEVGLEDWGKTLIDSVQGWWNKALIDGWMRFQLAEVKIPEEKK